MVVVVVVLTKDGRLGADVSDVPTVHGSDSNHNNNARTVAPDR